jgi:hypothetical protein
MERVECGERCPRYLHGTGEDTCATRGVMVLREPQADEEPVRTALELKWDYRGIRGNLSGKTLETNG